MMIQQLRRGEERRGEEINRREDELCFNPAGREREEENAREEGTSVTSVALP